jgi:hypothetical protein
MIASPNDKSIDVFEKLADPSEALLNLFETDANQEEIFNEMDKNQDRCCLVKDKDKTYGYIEMSTGCDIDKSALDAAETIYPESIISAKMSILDLIPLFQNKYFFFVLVGNEIEYYVSFLDMDKIPVKLSLFCLLMQLESELLKLLSDDTTKLKKRMQRFKKEKQKRYDKAVELCTKKYGPKFTTKNILYCTTFVDKKMILFQNSQLVKKFFKDIDDADHFFNISEKVRNQIAHSESILTVFKNPKEFIDFIKILRNVIIKLDSSTK